MKIHPILICILVAFVADSLQAQPVPPTPNPPLSANYELAPNDSLEIRVFQEEDLTTLARIPKDGVITFPLIGKVSLGGKSVAEAAEAIRSRLASRFLVNPQVTVTIQEYGKRRFTVIGQVQKPGAYDFPNEEGLDLLEAIAMAGGYTKIANASDVAIKRAQDGREIVYRLNARKIARKEGAEKFAIRPGDTITVSESIF